MCSKASIAKDYDDNRRAIVAAAKQHNAKIAEELHSDIRSLSPLSLLSFDDSDSSSRVSSPESSPGGAPAGAAYGAGLDGADLKSIQDQFASEFISNSYHEFKDSDWIGSIDKPHYFNKTRAIYIAGHYSGLSSGYASLACSTQAMGSAFTRINGV